MGIWQTSKYDPSYCQKVVEIMSTGRGFINFCAEVSIAESTGYNWIKEYPEFAAAYEVASAKQESAVGDQCLTTTANPALFIFRAANLTRGKWRRSDEKHTQETVTKVESATEEQLEAELKRIRAERNND